MWEKWRRNDIGEPAVHQYTRTPTHWIPNTANTEKEELGNFMEGDETGSLEAIFDNTTTNPSTIDPIRN